MTIVLHCRQCGLPFLHDGTSRRICSRECREARHREQAKRDYHRRKRFAPPQRPCRNCGTIFTMGNGFIWFCSEHCRHEQRLRIARARWQNPLKLDLHCDAEAVAVFEEYKERKRIRARARYHHDVDKSRAKSRKHYERVRELRLKGLALEKLQQEGLL